MKDSQRSAGFTLIELLVVISMLGIITAATFSLFRSQSQSFRSNTQRFDLVQNVRSAIELSERTIRTMGAGVAGEQPVLVYGANNVLAFNADYTERDTVDMRWAAYWNSDTPVEETVAWDVASASTIPNSSPGYTYPTVTYRLGNGSLSPAETYILWFESDAGTSRSDDYILWQRLNNGTPEILSRNLLPATDGRPFFEFLMHRNTSGADDLIIATGSLLPLIRRPLSTAVSGADSADFSRPDSVRAVRLNFKITNGQSGAEERFREVTTVVEVPNNGIPMPTVCGRAPFPVAGFTAVESPPGSGVILLRWTRSTDQDAGEVDVRQYVVWRKLAAAPAFAEPLLVVRSEADTVDYLTDVGDHAIGSTYTFGVAAQDCTPSFSSILQATVTVTVP